MWNLVYFAAQAYLLLLLARIVLSWFPPSGPGVMESIRRGLFAVTEPVLAPVRNLLPPVRMGGMGLDLSPLIVFLVLEIIIAWVPH